MLRRLASTALPARSTSVIYFEQRAGYAARPDEGKGGGGGRRETRSGDPRFQMLRNTLYPPNAGPPPKVAPLSGREVERRAVIEKAWTIFQQRQTERQLQDLKAKFNSMRLALKVLRRVDSRLYKGALAKSSDLLFPRRLNPPTETPPTEGWK